MLTVHPQYIKDANGNKSLVIFPAKEFDTVMEELEELEDIKLYDEAKKSNEPSIYDIFDDVRVVDVIDLGHRKDIYE